MTTKLEAAYNQAKTHFTAFKQVVYRGYTQARHLNALDRVLMQVTRYVETEGESGINRLIIEMPPRHGKSLSTSRLYPAWHLGRNPDSRIMLVSYATSLATANSRAVRNLINEPRYKGVFPHMSLSADSAAKDEWELGGQWRGGITAGGVMSGITGKGADVLIIDDPIKNRAEAESATTREKLWKEYTDTLLTRLSPNGVIIVMATRWHIDDLTGRLLKNERDSWKRLRLPALAEDNDPLGRDVGEALWAERYDREYLLDVQQKSGDYSFSSLYQQRPIASKAGLFDTSQIETVSHVPDDLDTVRFYDLAVTAKKTSDYTAGVKLGKHEDGTIYILDVYREQKTPTQVEADIAATAKRDGIDTPIRLEAEKAGIVQLDYLLRRDDLRGYRIDTKAPVGDKYTRAQPFASRVNAGLVKMRQAEWNYTLLDELGVFPMGKHDDQVDALSGAYDMLVHSVTDFTDDMWIRY